MLFRSQKWDKEYLVIKSDLIISPIYDDTTFEVIFKNKENEIIKTETVTYGNDATPPTLDNIEGYTFNGWSEDYTNVTSSITVNPKYIRNMYTVKFIDIDGNTLKEENIEHGEFIIAPPAPIIEGKTFNSWDKEFDNIKDYGIGLFIDIYPLDGCGQTVEEAKKCRKKMALKNVV